MNMPSILHQTKAREINNVGTNENRKFELLCVPVSKKYRRGGGSLERMRGDRLGTLFAAKQGRQRMVR